MSTNKVQILGARFVIREKTFHQTASSPFQIAAPNPLRTGLIFSVPTSAPANVSTDADAGKLNGIVIPPSAPPTQFLFKDHGALVQLPWFALETNSNYDLTVIEIEYHEDW